MKREIWDVFDADGNLTGKTVVRGKFFLKPDEYHLVVHIWITSSDGRILIQRRSDKKKLMPGEWAATGGAAISGESSFEAAKRELFEELGIPSTEETLKQILHLKRRNTILDIWAITCDTDPKDLKLQKNEVAEVRLVTVEEFNEMVKSGNFHNYGNDYFEQVLSAITTRKGATV